MTPHFFQVLLDIVGIGGCVIDVDNRVCGICAQLQRSTNLGIGDTIAIKQLSGSENVVCMSSEGALLFEARCLSESGYKWLIDVPQRADLSEEFKAFAQYIKQELVMPTTELTRSIAETISYIGKNESISPILANRLNSIQNQARFVEYSSEDVWYLLAMGKGLPVRGDERLEPRLLFQFVIAGLDGKLDVFLKDSSELGVIYGCKDWLVLSLQAVVNYMKQQFHAKRVGCELYQCNGELLMTFQDIGIMASVTHIPLMNDRNIKFQNDNVIDLDMASSIIRIHGGSIRINTELSRVVVSIPTGAPGEIAEEIYLKKIEAELMDLAVQTKSEDGL
ncbi:hypothetical protein ACMXYV_15830 [Neptuniibacter sp. SY11_33]|uniref:hypothetical protein n=1 Tax=Neptuniibacter sp. SY11_33 TaxID=3398215 RepID=UPI0039F4E7E3